MTWFRTTDPRNIKPVAALLLGLGAALALAVDGDYGPCLVAAAAGLPWAPDAVRAMRRRGDR